MVDLTISLRNPRARLLFSHPLASMFCKASSH